MQVMFGDDVQYLEKSPISVFPFRECLVVVLLLSESMKRRRLIFGCLPGGRSLIGGFTDLWDATSTACW